MKNFIYRLIFFIFILVFVIIFFTGSNFITENFFKYTGFPKFIADQKNINLRIDKLEDQNKLLKSRFEELNKSQEFTENLAISSIKFFEKKTPNCTQKYKIINLYDLKIDMVKKITKIELDELNKLLNKEFIIKKILPYSDALNDRSFIYSKISTLLKNDSLIIKVLKDFSFTTPHFLDYVLYAENFDNISNNNCKIILRIIIGEAALSDNPNWNIINGFGKVGFGIGELSLPYGTEFKDNKFWVTDCINGNISLFNERGEFIDYFGSKDNNMSYLNAPADIKVTKDKVYVVEENNHMVQFYSKDGSSLGSFGGFIEQIENVNKRKKNFNKFNNPLGIAVNDEQILVVDYGNDRVIAYDNNFKKMWVSDSKIWDGPYYAEYISKRKSFVVVNRGANNIVLINRKGEITQVNGDEVLDYPHEVAVDVNGNLLVANYAKHSVVIFNEESNYEQYEEIIFPESYGLIKTVATIDENNFLAGFVSNGHAYFLHLRKNKKQQSFSLGEQNFKNSNSQLLTKIKISLNNENNSFNKYKIFCSSCHEKGNFGAPQRGNIESWKKYEHNNLNDLAILVSNGEGSMLTKSGCTECSLNDFQEIIKIMLPMNWNKTYSN